MVAASIVAHASAVTDSYARPACTAAAEWQEDRKVME